MGGALSAGLVDRLVVKYVARLRWRVTAHSGKNGSGMNNS